MAEHVMSGVLAALPEGTRCVNYADNVTVLATTEAEAIRVRDTLVRALMRSPAGNLGFGTNEIARIADGFDFLGYTIKTMHGMAVAAPTDENLQEIFDKFIGCMHRKHHYSARECVRRWAAQFRLWPNIDLWLEWAFSEVDCAVDNDRAEMADVLADGASYNGV